MLSILLALAFESQLISRYETGARILMDVPMAVRYEMIRRM